MLERAKRLVEAKKDVVILLDSITRLARGYNTGRQGTDHVRRRGSEGPGETEEVLWGGAQRGRGGSLTILATALTETGSRMDQVILRSSKAPAI